MLVESVVSVVLVLVMLATSWVLGGDSHSVLPGEGEILTELRTIPLPYDTEIYYIAGFLGHVNDGYTDSEPSSEPGNGDSNAPREVPHAGIVFESLSFSQLVDRALYYDDTSDYNNARTCLDRAYWMYQAGNATGQWHDIGNMWYLKARYDRNRELYRRAADAFLQIGDRYNAGRMYWLLCWFQKEGGSLNVDDAGTALEHFIAAIETGDSADNSAWYFRSIYPWLYPRNMADVRPRFCELVPDDVFVNTIDIIENISEGKLGESDRKRVSSLLARSGYENCPKLLILDAYFRHATGEDFSCDRVYGVYLDHPGYFEPEDVENLAWLLYEAGDYSRAYSVTAARDAAVDSMILLRAESYLQGVQQLGEVDEAKLYREVTNALSINEGDSAKDSDTLSVRLRFAQCLLAGRLGLDPSYDGLADAAANLFGGGDATGRFIVAPLYCQDGRYDECLTICRNLLEDAGDADRLRNRTMFLCADALVGEARTIDDAAERMKRYESAEEILTQLRSSLGGDYALTLQRLHDLYLLMGKDEAAVQVAEDLETLR